MANQYVLYGNYRRRNNSDEIVMNYFVKHHVFGNEITGDIAKAARFLTPQGARLAANKAGLGGRMKPMKVPT